MFGIDLDKRDFEISVQLKHGHREIFYRALHGKMEMRDLAKMLYALIATIEKEAGKAK